MEGRRHKDEVSDVFAVSYTHLDVYKRQEHTIPVRIHNPRELLMVDLKPNA